ncbi:hypothetical protein J3459_011980 [Metarhizium acridum]|nr:hypothetical protein J3459_011980 [Metarhizium acridum]
MGEKFFSCQVASSCPSCQPQLLLVPELVLVPGNAQIPRTTVGRVRANLVVEAAAWRVTVTKPFLAIDMDAEAVVVGIMDRSTALLDAHDELRAAVAVKGLLDGNARPRHGVDFELASKLATQE